VLGQELGRPLRGRLDYRHPIDLGEKVELVENVHESRYEVAFVVGDLAKAVARVEPL
jgi:acyl-ACP thioesterase